MSEETIQSTWEKFQKEIKNPTLCGACGQFYEENEQGRDGYHSALNCDAADDLDQIMEKLSNLINSTESYLRTESSKTYDDAAFKNHLRGEVSGYKIALDLIKAAK
jgi:hypothetical protein